jgi:glycosyltransferase involved in cell wall biosynthesis
MNPSVSVIIPFYNQGGFLTEAIASLLTQTVADWECIIVNDGSTDNTATVAEDLAQADARIRLVNQTNKGLSAARNIGIKEAKGDYFQFLDADDIILPNKFELQLAALADINNIKLCYCNHRVGERDDLNKDIYIVEPPTFLLQQSLFDIILRWESELSIPIHSFLFDAGLFRENKILFDETLPNHEDWDFLIRIFSLHPTVKYINQTLAVYRIHQNSMCADQYKMWLGVDLVLNKYLKLSNHDKVIRQLFLKKQKQMKLAYYDYRPLNLIEQLSVIFINLYKQNTPWPIQKLVINISNQITRGHS